MKSILYSNTPCHEGDVHCGFLHHKVHKGKLNYDTDGTVLQLHHHHKPSISAMRFKMLANVPLLSAVQREFIVRRSICESSDFALRRNICEF